MENQLHHPPVPYVGPVCGGQFTPGNIVRVQGTIDESAYRFHINLQCGPKIIQDDVAVQVLVRLMDDYISLNSLQNRIWGEEHGASLPIKHNKNFEIVIMCESKQYKVVINGQYYCEFPHRINYNRITHLAIDGDISLIYVAYESALGNLIRIRSGNAEEIVQRNDCDTDNFETVDVAKAFPPPNGSHARPGVFRRRSYESAIYGGNQVISTSPSPDVDFQRASAFYSTKMPPCPSGRLGTVSPISTNGSIDTPYQTSGSGNISICPSPLHMTKESTPLVAPKSSVHLESDPKNSWCYCCSTFWGIIIGAIFILGFLLLHF